jgi:hypothetical protein
VTGTNHFRKMEMPTFDNIFVGFEEKTHCFCRLAAILINHLVKKEYRLLLSTAREIVV